MLPSLPDHETLYAALIARDPAYDWHSVADCGGRSGLSNMSDGYRTMFFQEHEWERYPVFSVMPQLSWKKSKIICAVAALMPGTRDRSPRVACWMPFTVPK